MRLRRVAMLAIVLMALFSLAQTGCASMLNIELQFSATTAVARYSGAVPVFAIASPVHLTIQFVNKSTRPLSMESPSTSQDLLLWLVALASGGESWTMLNPSRVDSTGEITAPIPVQMQLKPGERTETTADLSGVTRERWFEPGVYELFVSYAGARSNRLRFLTELRAESVPALIDLSVSGPDAWIREHATALLQRIPLGPDRSLPRNAIEAKLFLREWESIRQRAEVREFFESAKTPGAPGKN